MPVLRHLALDDFVQTMSENQHGGSETGDYKFKLHTITHKYCYG